MEGPELARLEIYHSRPVAPTRRVALGSCLLPMERPLQAGALLLGAVVGKYLRRSDEELRSELESLLSELGKGMRISQPRLRHRLQDDRIGLTRSVHRLKVDGNGRMKLDSVDRGGTPAQHILGAVYAAGTRSAALLAVWGALGWRGGSTDELLEFLRSSLSGARAAERDFGRLDASRSWAMEILGFKAGSELRPLDVQRRFRMLVSSVHPDAGGSDSEAASRIGDLLDARRILLDSACGLLLFPGAGGDSRHHALAALQHALDPLPVRCVDYPHRQEGRRRPPPAAQKLIPFVVEQAAAMCSDEGIRPERLVLGGRSMGGRLCSMAVAEGLPSAGLLLLSYPLHPPRKPERLRTGHFPGLNVPCLFVSGDRDPFGKPSELTEAVSAIPGQVEMTWLSGCGHDPPVEANGELTAGVKEWLGGVFRRYAAR